jgi:phage recombination protein Bet
MNALTIAPSTAATTYSDAQLRLIRDTVARDCNPQEFDLFVTVARHAGLDPFRKQISAIVFSKDDPKKRRMSIITTIDGLRVIAARSQRYRPDEDEPEFEIDPELKDPLCNPAGLVKAKVRIWIADAMREGGWKPVTGVAYWEEFAPIKDEASEGYDWVDTGEFWDDSGKPKRKKVPRAGSEMVRKLETGGNWGKMPRVMLAKCAEAQALRKAFPEDLSSLYEASELDRAQVIDVTPTEQVGRFEAQQRLERVNGGGVTLQFFPNTPLETVPLGKLADRIVETVEGFSEPKILAWFESANTQPLREFWARAPGEALEVKKVIEKCRAKLAAQSEAAA